ADEATKAKFCPNSSTGTWPCVVKCELGTGFVVVKSMSTVGEGQMSTRAAIRDGARRQSQRGGMSHKRELDKQKQVEEQLRQELQRNEVLLREMEAQLTQQQVLIEEFDHRLINSVQLIASILSLQSRATHNPEAAVQLAAAANRVAAIERV